MLRTLSVAAIAFGFALAPPPIDPANIICAPVASSQFAGRVACQR